MKAAILAIGTELTRGELCDSNSYWLSEQLTDRGVDVLEHATVDDDAERIGKTLLRLGQTVDLVLVTGGLGPTSDDLTAAAAASALGVALQRDAASLVAIEARYQAAGRVMPETNRKQADFPEGAKPLPNAVGTAPGFQCAIGGAQAFFMPGVPREMRHLFERHVLPSIDAEVQRSTHQVHLRTFGLPESLVAEKLADLELGGGLHDSRVVLGYRASFPEIEVKMFARADSEEVARELAVHAGRLARERLGTYVYGGREDSLPAVVSQVLQERSLRVATAESCTGGLIARLLTDVPGSSAYYVGGIVAYQNSVKEDLLDVDSALLKRHGAVSREVVAAMAQGALQRFGVDLAVATSGIAGPGGGSPEKPVGTVWFACARRDGAPVTVHRRFSWGREGVRVYSAHYALMLIRDLAQGTFDPTMHGDPLPPS